ncbi:MAG: shikimate dehydrogenase [Candidatus Omnitrophica bacterium]|nr:shikimate dehydrogenase [Candidatus Omnitrophota bacterium]
MKVKIMKTYGLLGRNINYSLSPAMHNAAFRALGLDAEYKIFDIPESGISGFFSDLKQGKISGCNVTIPHKEKTLEFVDECHNLAKDIGAVNTVVTKAAKLHGYNTDYQGFVKALTGKNENDLDFNPKGKEIFVFGAGGASRAVIFGLVTLGAKKIAIVDIDEAKAEELASSVIKTHVGNSLITVVKDRTKYEEFISKSDLLINATPCGVEEKDPTLFDYRYIHEKLHVFDLIYTKETRLVKEARPRSGKSINGLNMLLYQATEAFTLWTGMPAPLEVMQKALREGIDK